MAEINYDNRKLVLIRVRTKNLGVTAVSATQNSDTQEVTFTVTLATDTPDIRSDVEDIVASEFKGSHTVSYG